MKYEYRKAEYFLGVTLTGLFCAGLFFFSIYEITQGFLPPLMILIAVLCFYTVWSTFLAKTNPKEIEVTENAITFSSFGQHKTYPLSAIQSFKIREFPSSGKLFLRINQTTPLSGRYWITTKCFNQDKELFDSLLAIEREKHPNGLKARARTTNMKYNEIKKRKKQTPNK